MNKDICFLEYEKKYSNFCKKRKRKRRILIGCFSISIIIFLIFTYIIKIFNPIVENYSIAEVNKLLAKSTNKAIESVNLKFSYEDLVKISYNSIGEIISISANQMKVNELSNFLAIKTQYELEKVLNVKIKIPLGTCSGISFLSGKGPKIDIDVSSIGTINCSFKTRFESAGINQTNHKIYVNIETKTLLILPFVSKNLSINSEYLISECLIVGKVPDIYFGFSSIKDIY